MKKLKLFIATLVFGLVANTSFSQSCSSSCIAGNGENEFDRAQPVITTTTTGLPGCTFTEVTTDCNPGLQTCTYSYRAFTVCM